MRVIRVAAMIVLLSRPAFAQHVQQAGEADKENTPGQIESDKRAKAAYEKSLGNIPDKGSTDPWGAVRNDAPKATGKAASAKPRTTK